MKTRVAYFKTNPLEQSYHIQKQKGVCSAYYTAWKARFPALWIAVIQSHVVGKSGLENSYSILQVLSAQHHSYCPMFNPLACEEIQSFPGLICLVFIHKPWLELLFWEKVKENS